MQILVRDNNVEQALRVLRKKVQREGVFREIKDRRFDEKPSRKKVRQKTGAMRHARKMARKWAIRDGAIAAPKMRLELGAAPARSVRKRAA